MSLPLHCKIVLDGMSGFSSGLPTPPLLLSSSSTLSFFTVRKRSRATACDCNRYRSPQ